VDLPRASWDDNAVRRFAEERAGRVVWRGHGIHLAEAEKAERQAVPYEAQAEKRDFGQQAARRIKDRAASLHVRADADRDRLEVLRQAHDLAVSNHVTRTGRRATRPAA
jgi:hypothetical protein